MATMDISGSTAAVQTGTSEALRTGDKGQAVSDLQAKLNEAFINEIESGKMLPLKVDGIYGEGTAGRVAEFQKAFKAVDGVDAATGTRTVSRLSTDGIYGKNTAASLEKVIADGPDQMRAPALPKVEAQATPQSFQDLIMPSTSGVRPFGAPVEIVPTAQVAGGKIAEVVGKAEKGVGNFARNVAETGERIFTEPYKGEPEVKADAEAIRASMIGYGTRESKMFEVLSKYSGNTEPLEKAYQEKYGENLRERIGAEIESPYQKVMVDAVYEGNQTKYEAYERAGELERGYRSAWGVNEKVILKALAGTTPQERIEALAAFRDIETSRGREGDFAKAVGGDIFATDVEREMVTKALSQGSIQEYQELYYSVVKGDFNTFRNIVNQSTPEELTALQREIALEYDVTDFSSFAQDKLDKNPIHRNNMLDVAAVNKLSRATFEVSSNIPTILPF